MKRIRYVIVVDDRQYWSDEEQALISNLRRATTYSSEWLANTTLRELITYGRIEGGYVIPL